MKLSKQTAVVLAGVVIFLGLFPRPTDMDIVSAFGSNNNYLHFILLTVQVSPAIPLLLSFVYAFSSFRLRAIGTWSLSIIIVLFGFSLTLLTAAFSGPATKIVLAQGASLTLAIVGVILLLTTKLEWAPTRVFAVSGLTIGVLAALWSLFSAAAIIYQTTQIAQGSPFCLAYHDEQNDEIEAFSDLRGFRFYTTKTGYKDTSTWYFHGVLIVVTDNGTKYYNWSPRSLRFYPVGPKRLFVPIGNSCEPQTDFWRKLSVI